MGQEEQRNGRQQQLSLAGDQCCDASRHGICMRTVDGWLEGSSSCAVWGALPYVAPVLGGQIRGGRQVGTYVGCTDYVYLNGIPIAATHMHKGTLRPADATKPSLHSRASPAERAWFSVSLRDLESCWQLRRAAGLHAAVRARVLH